MKAKPRMMSITELGIGRPEEIPSSHVLVGREVIGVEDWVKV